MKTVKSRTARRSFEKPAETFKFEVEVPAENVRSVIESAVSSSTYGCCYWADVVQGRSDRIRGAYRLREKETAPNGRPGPWLILDDEAIQRGLALMAVKTPGSLSLILKGDGDGPTGDLLIQFALLGEERYG